MSQVIIIRCYDTGNSIEEEQRCGIEFVRPPARTVTGYCSVEEAWRLFSYIKKLQGWHINEARSPRGIWNAGRED